MLARSPQEMLMRSDSRLATDSLHCLGDGDLPHGLDGDASGSSLVHCEIIFGANGSGIRRLCLCRHSAVDLRFEREIAIRIAKLLVRELDQLHVVANLRRIVIFIYTLGARNHRGDVECVAKGRERTQPSRKAPDAGRAKRRQAAKALAPSGSRG